MTTLHLVRHGPTHARAMVGWSDIPADLGDTAALARLDAGLPGDAPVISSDLSRTATTADALAGARPRLPHDPDLREINFGRWEMRAFAEIEAEDPDLAAAYWSDPGSVRAPGGESWDDMRARVDPAIDRLVAAHRGGAVIVVTHFGVILGQVGRALGVPPAEVLGQRIDNLSVTVLTRTATRWRLGAVNHRP